MVYGQTTPQDKIHTCCHMPRKLISWSAIFAGAFVGIGLSFLFNLFSLAIGLSVFSITNKGLISITLGGLIGLVIGVIVAMYLAGFSTGFLGRHCSTKHNLGILSGFITWCLIVIFTMFLTSYLGRYLSVYANFISNPSTIIVSSNAAVPTVKVMNLYGLKGLGMESFVVFILFFISAVSCCTGCYHGMECCKDTD